MTRRGLNDTEKFTSQVLFTSSHVTLYITVDFKKVVSDQLNAGSTLIEREPGK